ncbi:MAG: translational machinery protein [Usitatibacteraceae bacterium]
MQANHVVVWLDHSEAHIIAFNRDVAEKATIVHAPNRREHLHHRADSVGAGKAAEHPAYYEEIIAKIRNIPEWLVVGPANAKLAFSKHLHKLHPNLEQQLIGLETVDHPSDGQLLAYARKYFVAADRMAGVPTPT